VAILLQKFLNGGTYAGERLISPATVKAMLTDQNAHLNGSWGVGWRLGNSPGREFGDLVSARTFGHLGASRTIEWADPESGLLCVALTSRQTSGG
jgi:CubicO group peptidase (beta-lactamase class C family)